MKQINVFEHAEDILKVLSKGAFLTVAAEGKANTMTIGWGNLGFQWGTQTFTVMVRETRYTKKFIDTNPCFTVSVPINDGFQKALGICGSKSGRDIDKYAESGLELMDGQSVNVPVIKNCGLHIECRVVETETMAAARFDGELTDKWYAAGNWHTNYTGVITAAYIE